MSGFSSDWLSLREPADHQARDKVLQTLVSKHFDTGHYDADHPLRIIDIGCGTGSNLRALYDIFPRDQHWVLIDHDVHLLMQARAQLSEWADNIDKPAYGESATNPHSIVESLSLTRGKNQIKVDFLIIDLAEKIEQVLSMPHDLVTCAAFFDLVSAAWIKRFCAALTTPLYTVLTYNGDESWAPSNPNDQAILKAFHQHQQTEKGFGAATGPQATALLKAELSLAAFKIQLGLSPWRLKQSKNQFLIKELAEGIAHAVSQTGQVDAQVLNAWLAQQRQASSCLIGHWDLFALPGKNN
jgi:hypothetical protein